MKKNSIEYPDGKKFIFTIFDDTDVATYNYIKPIYEFFYEHGILTTKSVWPLSYSGICDYNGSDTLEDKEYNKYMKRLSDRGFEIAFHGPSMQSSNRERIVKAFEIFYNSVGYYPRNYAAHSKNRENIYWGSERFSFPIFKLLYKIIFHNKNNKYSGHKEGSEYFWGDISFRHIDYMRNLTYNDINLMNISKTIVYKNLSTPWIKSWYISCDADNVEAFNRVINEENQDKLENHGGICIINTHLGKGFCCKGKLHSETARLLKRLSLKKGWFVPVSTVLDYLIEKEGIKYITKIKLFQLEYKWIIHAIRRKFEKSDYLKTEIPYLKK